MYYVYILLNGVTKRYYIGYTLDLRNRLKEHLSGNVISTKSNLNYNLVFYSAFKHRKDASLFERYLKSGSGVAFMKKRFLKSELEALAKDIKLNLDD